MDRESAHRRLADACIRQGALDGDVRDRTVAGDSIARQLGLSDRDLSRAVRADIDRWAATFATRQGYGWDRRAA